MTRGQLTRRVELWRRRLAPEWRLTLLDERPSWASDDCYAAICRDGSYTHAKLHVTDDGLDRPDREVDVTIVHELLHAVLREMGDSVEQAESECHPSTWANLWERFRHHEEQVADRLSRAIVAAGAGEWPSTGTTSC